MSDNIDNDEVFEKATLNNIQAEARRDRTKKFSSIVAGMSSTIAIGIMVSMLVSQFLHPNKTLSQKELTGKITQIESELHSQNKNIQIINASINDIKIGLDEISNLPEGSEWKSTASKLTQNISTISNKLNALENALTLNPAKALAVPLLRKDLDNAEKSLRSDLEQTRSNIDRIYDQNKWFIGLMFTLSFGVLGMAVSSFLNKK